MANSIRKRVFLVALTLLFCVGGWGQNVDLFDSFLRDSADYGDVVGLPTSNPGSNWLEYETEASGARTSGGGMWMGSGITGRDMISFDMTGHYPVAFDEATELMRWAWNMRSNHDEPSGFNSGYYGSAFILGSNKSDFTDPDAYGYAVVIGQSGVTGQRSLRLVRFHDGLILNSTIDEIASVALVDDNSFLSVNVEYNSCGNTWSLKAREDTVFTQPSIGVFPLLNTGVDDTYTATEIPHLGALWNHNTTSTEYLRIDNIYIPETTIATDNEYTWNIPSGTGDFNMPGNWTPTRDCARNRDKLIFDGGASEVTGVPDQTIGQLIVQNNASIIFRNLDSDTTSTLVFTGGLGEDFIIESGSVLNFNSKNASYTTEGIVFNMNTSTTGEIGGTLQFDNSFNIDGRRHQLLVADTDALYIKNGGKVEAIHLLLSSHPFGDSGATNAVIFESGSTYLQASGSNPFGYDQPGSKVVFESGSWFHFTASGEPSISGRTYANFRYEAGTTNIALGTTNYHIDTLFVDQGALNLNLNANATLAGDIVVASLASLGFDPGTLGSVLIDAPVIQNIYGNGTMTIGANSTLNLQNQVRINIQKDIAVDGNANVLANAVVDFEAESNFSGSGTTSIQADSKVYLGSAGGIAASGSTGNIRTNVRTYADQAAYVYDGPVNQITGTGLPVTLSGNGSLEIDNPGNTVTLTHSGTTTTPLLTLTDGSFSVGASNIIALSANGNLSSLAGNFAAGNGAGTVVFVENGTVNAAATLDFRNVDLPAGSGGVNFGSTGAPTIHNELVIGQGRSVITNGPFYANNSTLVYNTGGDFTAEADWSANFTSGRGVPYNVQVGRVGVNDTKLNFGSSNAWRYCRGSVIIGDAGGGSGYGFYLSTEDSGDLKLEGDFLVEVNGTFGANQRAVFFVGNTDQTITSYTGSVDFDYLVVEKSGGDLLLDDNPATAVSALGNSAAGIVLVLSNGDLDLQGQTFNLGGSAPYLLVTNGNKSVKSSSAANFNVIGPKEVQSSNSGALIFNDQVTVNISDSMDFGNDLTTINATLQINPNGYVNANAPRYGLQGVLKYNTGGVYLRRAEWNGTEGNPGYPNDVIVAGVTELRPGGDNGGENTATPFGARHDVTIEAGSKIYMDYGSIDMTVPLIVGNDLIIDGELSASDEIGGDIFVGRNWIRSSSGVFNPRDRQVKFNGTGPQSITADGGETFDSLAFENAGTKTLNADITVNQNLDIFSGSGALTPSIHSISLSGNWNNEVGSVGFDEGNSTVIFMGNTAQKLVSSDGETFYNLKMINSDSGLVLMDPISVLGNLNLQDGLIHTGTSDTKYVEFKLNASWANSSSASYINGFARKTGFATGEEFKFPVGQFSDGADPIDVYQPAALIAESESASASFTVDYHHTSYFPGYTDPNNLPPMQLPLVKASTCNYWNINRTTAGTDAKVKLYWTDACLDINNPALLVVAKVVGDTEWVSQGQSAVNSLTPFDAGFVVSNVVSGFSPFAIGSESAFNVLPIELLSFTAFAKNKEVVTQWITSTEMNNDFFTVERSLDAVTFEVVGRVEGVGNSTSERSYSYIDDAPFSGISYYRLSQTDFDGNTTFSEIRSVEISGDGGFELLQVYRSEDGLNLNFKSDEDVLSVTVFDLVGKRLFILNVPNSGGRALIHPSLARGIYLLRLSNGVETKTKKFFF